MREVTGKEEDGRIGKLHFPKLTQINFYMMLRMNYIDFCQNCTDLINICKAKSCKTKPFSVSRGLTGLLVISLM